MRANELKVGYPLYYIESTQLLFENAFIAEMEKIDFIHKSVYRVTLHRNDKSYIGFTDIKLDDTVYLTEDEYNNRVAPTEGTNQITFYEKNIHYWDYHKKEFDKIKRKAFLYRFKKRLKNINIL